MSITLNPLFEGLDGNPPQTIKLSGTVSDAELFQVKVDDNPESGSNPLQPSFYH